MCELGICGAGGGATDDLEGTLANGFLGVVPVVFLLASIGLFFYAVS